MESSSNSSGISTERETSEGPKVDVVFLRIYGGILKTLSLGPNSPSDQLAFGHRSLQEVGSNPPPSSPAT